MKRGNVYVLTALLSAGLLTGCGGARSSVSTDMAYESTYAETMAAGAMSGSYTMKAAAPQANSEVMQLTEDDTPMSSISESASTAVPTQSTARKLIRTINLQVETTEFDALLDQLNQKVIALGGYVEQSDVSGSSISASEGARRYASMTVRVPSNHLEEFVTDVDAKGNITNRSENTQDVTLQYSDVESRKKTLAVEQDRLWDLLAKADSVDAVIALESRLSEIRYQLESLESQLRTYDNQIDYSTVYLYIDEVKVFTPTTPDSIASRIQKGFTRNLADVSDGLVNLFIWLISSIPAIIAAAIIIVVIFIVVRLIHTLVEKQHTKRTLNKPTKTTAPETTIPQKQQPTAAPQEISEQQSTQQRQQ